MSVQDIVVIKKSDSVWKVAFRGSIVGSVTRQTVSQLVRQPNTQQMTRVSKLTYTIYARKPGTNQQLISEANISSHPIAMSKLVGAIRKERDKGE